MTATVTEPAHLIAPDRLPGFDATGLAVATWDSYWAAEPEPNGYHLLVAVRAKDVLVVHWSRDPLPDGPLRAQLHVRSRYALQVGDARTRDQLSRYIASRERLVGIKGHGAVAPGWKRQDTGWALMFAGGGTFYASQESARFPLGHPRLVPALWPLVQLGRLKSQRMLPDGSALVDALALGIVAVHVGSRS